MPSASPRAAAASIPRTRKTRLVAVAVFSVAGAAVNRWSTMPTAWESRPKRREISPLMRWLANALSRMTNGP